MGVIKGSQNEIQNVSEALWWHAVVHISTLPIPMFINEIFNISYNFSDYFQESVLSFLHLQFTLISSCMLFLFADH